MADISEKTIKRRRALIETMTFFDIFDFALTREELCDYILYEKWTLSELNEFANHEEFLLETHSHVFFRGRSHITKTRKIKELEARKLYKKAKKYVKYMQMLPFVRCVALCNSLAFYDADKDSDIDLFIITERNRLFIARAFVWIFTQLLGIRRHGKKIKGRFCLSFIISRDDLNLEKILIKNDIYLLFWIRLMRPLIGQEVYREFIKANSWIHNYFNYEIDQKLHLLKPNQLLQKFQKILEYPTKGKFGNIFENIMKKIQIKRCRNKITTLKDPKGTIVSDTMLKFHNVDMRQIYSDLWEKRYSQFKKYINPGGTYFEIPALERYHRSRRLFGFRSPDTADKKNVELPHH